MNKKIDWVDYRNQLSSLKTKEEQMKLDIQMISQFQNEEDLTMFYKINAKYYDNETPNFAPETIDPLKSLNLPKDARIIDFCCGTGMAVEVFKSLGYDNVDGLDASEEMVNETKKYKFYKNIFIEYINENTPIKSVKAQSYDLVYCLGSFYKNHLNRKHIRPILDLVKIEGYFLFWVNDDSQLDDLKVFNEINNLKDEGLIDVIQNIDVEYYGRSKLTIVKRLKAFTF
jgi:SAM-dependent methyltransferase